jgi:hypothetical protein
MTRAETGCRARGEKEVQVERLARHLLRTMGVI